MNTLKKMKGSVAALLVGTALTVTTVQADSSSAAAAAAAAAGDSSATATGGTSNANGGYVNSGGTSVFGISYTADTAETDVAAFASRVERCTTNKNNSQVRSFLLGVINNADTKQLQENGARAYAVQIFDKPASDPTRKLVPITAKALAALSDEDFAARTEGLADIEDETFDDLFNKAATAMCVVSRDIDNRYFFDKGLERDLNTTKMTNETLVEIATIQAKSGEKIAEIQQRTEQTKSQYQVFGKMVDSMTKIALKDQGQLRTQTTTQFPATEGHENNVSGQMCKKDGCSYTFATYKGTEYVEGKPAKLRTNYTLQAETARAKKAQDAIIEMSVGAYKNLFPAPAAQ